MIRMIFLEQLDHEVEVSKEGKKLRINYQQTW